MEQLRDVLHDGDPCDADPHQDDYTQTAEIHIIIIIIAAPSQLSIHMFTLYTLRLAFLSSISVIRMTKPQNQTCYARRRHKKMKIDDDISHFKNSCIGARGPRNHWDICLQSWADDIAHSGGGKKKGKKFPWNVTKIKYILEYDQKYIKKVKISLLRIKNRKYSDTNIVKSERTRKEKTKAMRKKVTEKVKH